MQPSRQPRQPEDPRVRFAGERTLLAWIRTGLAMMGFGFVVARFGLFLRELSMVAEAASPSRTLGVSLWIGAALVVLGVAVNLIAAWQHVQFLRRVEAGEPYRPTKWSSAVIVAVALAVIGIGMVIYLVFMPSPTHVPS